MKATLFFLQAFDLIINFFLDQIWQRRSLSPRFRIGKTEYLNPSWNYLLGVGAKTFHDDLDAFKSELTELVSESKGRTYFKFGDGDFFFLRDIPHGSAEPGKRAISKRLNREDLDFYRSQALLSDKYLCEKTQVNQWMFREIFGRQPDFPAEFAYGLLASRWLTKSFSGEIALIGSNNKLAVIRELLQFEEYREYIGTQGFVDYIGIPERFAADKPRRQIQEVGEQVSKSKAKLFLLGVGHLKSGLLPSLRQSRDAVFLDIGSGIDALAGIVDTRRPYMGAWTNFQCRDSNLYKDLDYLNFNQHRIKLLK